MQSKYNIDPPFENGNTLDQFPQLIHPKISCFSTLTQIIIRYKVYFVALICIILTPIILGLIFYNKFTSERITLPLFKNANLTQTNHQNEDILVRDYTENGNVKIVTSSPIPVKLITPTPYNQINPSNTTTSINQINTNNPTSTPIPTPIPTPTPKIPDYHFSDYGKLIRQYDNGSGSGPTTSYYDYSSSPSFDPVIDLWHDSVKACIQIQDSNFASNIWVSLTIEDNGNQISARDIHPGDEFCKDLSITNGEHKIKISLNPGKTVTETDYNNNFLQFSYTMNPDTQAPTYDIFGPIKVDGQGTCMFAQHLSDNITFNADIHLEQYIDGQLLTSDQYGRVCIQANAGESHNYRAKATDKAGNTNEQSKQFTTL